MVTSMLEKAIEIEGLLRIIRDGNPLPETYILLNVKTAELAEQAGNLEDKTQAPAPEPQHADFVMASPQPQVQTATEVTFTVESPLKKEESLARTIDVLTDLGEPDSGIAVDDLSLIEEDDIILSFDDNTESGDFQIASVASAEIAENEPHQQNAASFTIDNDTAPSASVAGTPTHSESGAQSEQGIEMEQAIPTEEPVMAQETIDKPDPKPEEPAAATPKRPNKLRSAFSLNDRFLYARELFNGNMKMFDSTLDFLEGIEEFSLIEDYFYSELEWDPEKSNVAAFMDILRPHFKE